MTKKHIYVNFSNSDVWQRIMRHCTFVGVPSYAMPHYEKRLPNEMGSIKTQGLTIHFLFSTQMVQENCPWCGSKCELIKNTYHEGPHIWHQKETWHVECIKCKARGPRLVYNSVARPDDREKDYLEAVIWQRFNTRKPWDDGFVNPYEAEK